MPSLGMIKRVALGFLKVKLRVLGVKSEMMCDWLTEIFVFGWIGLGGMIGVIN
jgi:hypothetical protein